MKCGNWPSCDGEGTHIIAWVPLDNPDTEVQATWLCEEHRDAWLNGGYAYRYAYVTEPA